MVRVIGEMVQVEVKDIWGEKLLLNCFLCGNEPLQDI